MRFVFALGLAAAMAACSILVDTSDLANGKPDAGTPSDAAPNAVPDATGTESGVAADGGLEAGPRELPNLIGAWLFEDGTNDSSGRGRHGNLSGDAKIAVAPGRDGYALALSGNGDMKVEVLDKTAFPNTGTISLWIRYTTMEKDTEQGFFDEWALDRDHVFVRHANGDAVGSIQISFQETDTYEFSDGFDLGANTWAHVVVTWDAMNLEGKVFVDGTRIAKAKYEGTAFTPTGQIVSFGRYLDGFIDDIRLYDRVLEDSEVLTVP